MNSVSLKDMQSTFGFKPNPQTIAGELPNDTPIAFVVDREKNIITEGELPPPNGKTHIVNALVFEILRKTRADVAMWDSKGKDANGVYHTLILADGSIAVIVE